VLPSLAASAASWPFLVSEPQTSVGTTFKIAELVWSATQTEPNPAAMLTGLPGSFSWPMTLFVVVSTRFSRSLLSAPNQNPPAPSALPGEAPPAVR
jgi:hypothetical protein